jgi:hypothetical protein
MQCSGVNSENSSIVNFDSMCVLIRLPARVFLGPHALLRVLDGFPCRFSAIIALFQIVTTSSWDMPMWY